MKHFVLVFFGILLIGCSSNKQSYLRQESPDTILTPISTMVLCLIPANDLRASFETEMKQELRFHNVHAETSTKYLPENLDKTSNSKKKLLDLIDSLPEKGFDQLLISAVTSIEELNKDSEAIQDYKNQMTDGKILLRMS